MRRITSPLRNVQDVGVLDGTFALDDMGGQVGELTPLGQLLVDEHDHVKFVSIYPHETATGKLSGAVMRQPAGIVVDSGERWAC